MMHAVKHRNRRPTAPKSFVPRLAQRSAEPEETLVRDVRADRRPSEMVESKLLGILRRDLVPVSQIRLTSCCGGRNRP